MDMNVGQTILDQFGGNRFVVMTGARGFVVSDDALSFTIPKNKSRANKVRVTLMPNDTYTVEFFKSTPRVFEALRTVEHVYADSLRSIFTAFTGLETSL